ncbi:MAG: hypothetical protein HYY97_00060 [Rhodocyclales bacterium]|nr:hypothetical protein [Rhodocyclales bacterium]
MTTPTITDYLKYSNLQMAAEAFLANNDGTIKLDIKQALIDGNLHASVFTATQATEFAAQWQVVAQKSNTGTGFSGTLFRCKLTDPAKGLVEGQLVLSFRSTEFIDDAVRDSAATNTLEIGNTGFAWGQIADMEAWYAELKADATKLGGKAFSVTGYSLGGHLATAFNLLHPGAAQQVVTFNGAGVGLVKQGSLVDAMNYFRDLLANPALIKTRLDLTLPDLASFYDTLRTNLANKTWSAAQARDALNNLSLTNLTESQLALFAAEKAPLTKALNDIINLQAEALRIVPLTAGGSGSDANASPKAVPAAEILAQTLDYRLAVDLAARNTEAATLIGGVARGLTGKEYLAGRASNQWDLVGKETTTPAWSAVANSLWHYGTDVPVFIEDQPIVRGSIVSGIVAASLDYGDVKLLVDKYNQNNFADTHSLVLIVDSLNVQNTLLQLLPEAQRSEAAATLNTLLNNASWRTAQNGDLITGNSQGQAEGDVLENIVNALADLFLGPQAQAQRLNGSPDGNTWWSTTDTVVGQDAYTGRDKLYATLKAVTDSDIYKNMLPGTLTLAASGAGLRDTARDDFGAYAALYSLSPFVFSTGTAAQAAVFDGSGLYATWKADQDARAAGVASEALPISDAWLADRAEFLQRKNWFNAQNLGPVKPILDPEKDKHTYQTDSTFFEDAASGYRIAQGFNPDAPAFDNLRTYYFGDERDNNARGRGVDDHLYGGAGNDRLEGCTGKDGRGTRDIKTWRWRYGDCAVKARNRDTWRRAA